MTDVASLPGKWKAAAIAFANNGNQFDAGYAYAHDKNANELESALAAISPAPSAGVGVELLDEVASWLPFDGDDNNIRARFDQFRAALSKHPAAPSVSPDRGTVEVRAATAVVGDGPYTVKDPNGPGRFRPVWIEDVKGNRLFTVSQTGEPTLAHFVARAMNASSAPQGVAETLYLGMLWRHAAASQRNDEAAEDMWAERADEVFKGVSKDYQDGARWLAHCVSEWDKATTPPAPAAAPVMLTDDMNDIVSLGIERGEVDCGGQVAAEQPQGEMVLVTLESALSAISYVEQYNGGDRASEARAMLSAEPSRPVVDEAMVERALAEYKVLEPSDPIEFNAESREFMRRLINAALGQQGDGNG